MLAAKATNYIIYGDPIFTDEYAKLFEDRYRMVKTGIEDNLVKFHEIMTQTNFEEQFEKNKKWYNKFYTAPDGAENSRQN